MLFKSQPTASRVKFSRSNIVLGLQKHIGHGCTSCVHKEKDCVVTYSIQSPLMQITAALAANATAALIAVSAVSAGSVVTSSWEISHPHVTDGHRGTLSIGNNVQ